jgi:Spy/CpxP family protein refolding chaperone
VKKEPLMSSTQRWCFPILSLTISAAAGLEGCSNSTSSRPPTTLTSVEVTAPGTAATPPVTEVTTAGALLPHRHGGVAILIVPALSRMEFSSPEERGEVDRITAQLNAASASVNEAWRRFDDVIADGVEKGHVERAKIDDVEAPLLAAMSDLHEASASAMNQLHSVLTPRRRFELMEKIDARWEAWKKLQGDSPPAHRRDVDVLRRDVGLTPEQSALVVGQLGTNLAVPAYEARIERHLRAFEQAFMSDTFDARTLDTERAANHDMGAWRADRIVRLYTAAAPVLTPEQRTKLAADLRRHAETSE